MQTNLDALDEGLELLNRLSSQHYVADQSPIFLGTLGAHYRHLIEHYSCFLNALSDQELSFDSRPREAELENDIRLAKERIKSICDDLALIDSGEIDNSLTVHDQQSDAPIVSTIGRELLFLQAHTVHHHAIIGAMARRLGVQIQSGFGVAVSTQAFANQLRKVAR